MSIRLFEATYATDGPQGPLIHREDFYVINQREVRAAIQDRGGYTLEIRERIPSLIIRMFQASRGYQLRLLRLLQNHVSGRISPARALSLMVAAETDRRRHMLLMPAHEIVARGGTFTEAMNAVGIFDAQTMGIIEAGDATSTVKDSLQHAVEQIEMRRKNARSLLSSLMIIVMDIFGAISSVGWMKFSFLPGLLEKSAESNKQDLVKQFQHSIAIATLVNDILFYIALAASIGGVIAYWLYAEKSTRDHPITQKAMSLLPGFRNYLTHIGLTDAFSGLGRMLMSRVTLIDAIKITSRSTPIRHVQQLLETAEGRLSTGDATELAFGGPLLTSSEIFEIGSQRNMRQLGETFTRLAETRSETAKRARALMIMSLTAVCMVYIAISVLSAIGALLIQSDLFNTELQSIWAH